MPNVIGNGKKHFLIYLKNKKCTLEGSDLATHSLFKLLDTPWNRDSLACNINNHSQMVILSRYIKALEVSVPKVIVFE